MFSPESLVFYMRYQLSLYLPVFLKQTPLPAKLVLAFPSPCFYFYLSQHRYRQILFQIFARSASTPAKADPAVCKADHFTSKASTNFSLFACILALASTDVCRYLGIVTDLHSASDRWCVD